MSTSNSLTKFVQDVKQGFNPKKSTLVVFVDFKGAYALHGLEKQANELAQDV